MTKRFGNKDSNKLNKSDSSSLDTPQKVNEDEDDEFFDALDN